MLVERQLIEMVWNNRTKHHYEKLGYEYTRMSDHFLIKVEDLPSNSVKDVNVICDCCSKTYKIRYVRYMNYNAKYKKDLCPICRESEKIRMKQKRHYEKISESCKRNGYTLITSLDDMCDSNIVIYSCTKHGKQITTVDNALCGCKCYLCGRDASANKIRGRNLSERQTSLYNKASEICKVSGYTLVSHKDDIKRNISKIKYICPKHGEHEIRIDNLINGEKCPGCVKDKARERYKMRPDEVERRINECGGILLNKYSYLNQKEKNLQIVCPSCKNTFTSSLVNFTQYKGQVCPDCFGIESNGERKIREFLEKNNMSFVQEKWFSDCKDKKPLPFDFYIPNINLIIEFDGRQHYEETGVFSESLEKIQHHDKIKTDYCIKNNIGILRIPYWNYDKIDTILQKQLFT